MDLAHLFFSVFFGVVVSTALPAQEQSTHEGTLDVSLFWKKSGEFTDRVESKDGDLYKQLGHHGPAIENAWAAYRIYFNDRASIDILSKFQPRLELKTTKWYADKSQKAQGYGMDNYLVKETVGLGGVRLWDGQSVQNLGPVAERTGEVILTDSTAQIRMTSYAIPYQGENIDLEIVITTLANTRHAVVEARILNGVKVQFATGITFHDQLKISSTDNYILTWGDYDSPVSATEFNVGAAIMFDPDDFERNLVLEQEHLIISKPTTSLKYYISTSNEREQSELNNYDAFEAYVRQLVISLGNE